jgi:hypothetical protein
MASGALAKMGLVLCAMNLATAAFAIEFGVNIHHGGATEFNLMRASVMRERNLKSARTDLIYDWDPAPLRDQVRQIRNNGGSAQAVVLTSHTWDHSCDPDLARVEQKAYAETSAAVDRVKDVVHDFELLNEVELRPDIVREVPRNSAGLSTTPYEGKRCVASLSAALRGMSRAIRDIRSRTGLPLRVLFGQSGRDWGLLYFMRRQGVEWDVTTWHVYPQGHHPDLSNDPWWGPGGPFVQLAAFGKPVHVNEFNCGEIYRTTYENRAGQPLTEECLQTFARQLRHIIDQKIAKIESVHVYELLDEPFKQSPEDRFGLLDELERPKPHLLLFTAFAGGSLSPEERCEITRRQLMTDSEIDARRRPDARGLRQRPCGPPCRPQDTSCSGAR